jgi:hypothetical protein
MLVLWHEDYNQIPIVNLSEEADWKRLGFKPA